MFKEKDPFTLVTGLIRQMMVEDYLYLVPFDMQNGQVLINRKHLIDATLRKKLTDAAVGLSGTFSMQTDVSFLQAINWISANFDMKQLQWGPETQHSPSTGGRSVATEIVKEEGLNRDIESLVHILTHPERLEGPRKTERYGTQENPNLMMTISIPLIETEASRKRRIEAARELGKIGGAEAGKALAECYSQSKGDDVKTAIAESLSKVLKVRLQQNPDSRLLPPDVYHQLDKAVVLFQQGELLFVISAAGEKALPFVAARLSKGDLEEKITCLSLLGKLGTDEAANILLQNLSSAEHRIRTAAINALAECGSPLAAVPLQEMLHNEHDKKARRRLLRAVLATVRQNAETPTQLEIMTEALVDPDLEARKAVTELLLSNEGTAQKLRLQLGDGVFVREKLRVWLNDPDMITHYTAIRGLAILGKPEDRAVLESARRSSGDSGAEIKKAISMIRARELS
jgi:HEAT repeat protein